MNLSKFNKLSNLIVTFKAVPLIFLGKAELFESFRKMITVKNHSLHYSVYDIKIITLVDIRHSKPKVKRIETFSPNFAFAFQCI